MMLIIVFDHIIQEERGKHELFEDYQCPELNRELAGKGHWEKQTLPGVVLEDKTDKSNRVLSKSIAVRKTIKTEK